MSQSFKLFRLQQIDTILDKGQIRLDEIDRLIADDLEIRLSQQRLERTRRKRFEAEKNLRLAEENVKSQRLKIERSQSTLYGGKVVNPKELQDLQQESEALKRYLETLEDHQLVAMLELDEAESQFREAENNLTDIENQVAAQRKILATEKSELIHDLQRQESERDATASNIDIYDMRSYDILRRQKNGIAVARVVEKTCAACGSTLTASTFSSAQVPTKITRCNSCGRILYVG
jgi:predicted  nucleic acid-binding Zn-ribbon protein